MILFGSARALNAEPPPPRAETPQPPHVVSSAHALNAATSPFPCPRPQSTPSRSLPPCCSRRPCPPSSRHPCPWVRPPRARRPCPRRPRCQIWPSSAWRAAVRWRRFEAVHRRLAADIPRQELLGAERIAEVEARHEQCFLCCSVEGHRRGGAGFCAGPLRLLFFVRKTSPSRLLEPLCSNPRRELTGQSNKLPMPVLVS